MALGLMYSFGGLYLLFHLDRVYSNYKGVNGIKCPEGLQRNIRAELCGPGYFHMYHCLYDVNENRHVEKCESPKEFTRGRKAVFSGNIDARVCSASRYMPFTYVSNMSADCLYQRSYCNEEGQIHLHGMSSSEDTTCLCDFTKGYAFVTEPKAVCYCVPSEEDCSCYKKLCRDDFVLSTNYSCVPKTSSFRRFRCQVSHSRLNNVFTNMEVFNSTDKGNNYIGRFTRPVTSNAMVATLIGMCLICLLSAFIVLMTYLNIDMANDNVGGHSIPPSVLGVAERDIAEDDENKKYIYEMLQTKLSANKKKAKLGYSHSWSVSQTNSAAIKAGITKRFNSLSMGTSSRTQGSYGGVAGISRTSSQATTASSTQAPTSDTSFASLFGGNISGGTFNIYVSNKDPK